jgi:hypothetical protein
MRFSGVRLAVLTLSESSRRSSSLPRMLHAAAFEQLDKHMEHQADTIIVQGDESEGMRSLDTGTL